MAEERDELGGEATLATPHHLHGSACHDAAQLIRTEGLKGWHSGRIVNMVGPELLWHDIVPM